MPLAAGQTAPPNAVQVHIGFSKPVGSVVASWAPLAWFGPALLTSSEYVIGIFGCGAMPARLSRMATAKSALPLVALLLLSMGSDSGLGAATAA